MVKKLTEKADIKIFILYLLRQIERPVEFATLNDIAVQDGFVHQFDFMDCFYELEQSGAVEKVTEEGEERYVISEKGTLVAETLESNITPAIRERSMRSALRLLSFSRRKARTSCRLEDEPGGKCRLTAGFRDGEGEFFSMALLLDTRHQAELMKKNCDENPELLYRSILGVLSGDLNYLADAWASDDCESEENISEGN